MSFAGNVLVAVLRRLAVVAALPLLVLFPVMVSADTVRRIVHPDGRVEYTDAAPQKQTRRVAKQETVYRYRDDNGVVTFSGAQPALADYDVIRFECYACRPDSNIDWRRTRLFRTPYQQEIQGAAREYQVDPALVRAVIHAESAFNPMAVSPKGAQGLMQLMPGTADEVGVSDALNAADNIRGGVHYLARMLQLHGGDVTLAAAAYNAGPGAVRRHGGVPPYPETRAYVERVAILHERYRENPPN